MCLSVRGKILTPAKERVRGEDAAAKPLLKLMGVPVMLRYTKLATGKQLTNANLVEVGGP